MEHRNTDEDAMMTKRSQHRVRTPRQLLTAIAAGFILFAASSAALAQQDYKTPQDAANALAAAAKSGDEKAALVVLGRGAEDLVSSGDKVSDDAVRERFVSSYAAKHDITMNGDAKATLIIGANDYPFPIPLERNKNGSWSFDADAGREEILARRIGHNEIDTIQTCLAYVDAQNDYAAKDRGMGVGVYAMRFISDSGKKDGLYWPAASGEEESPLGELFATATKQGYKAGEGRAPYHGYYYKILTKQGPAATGGAADYVVKGKMIGGFALVAYPAEYRNSGVMTFMVNHDGAIFQKDFGPKTEQLAEAITAFNPDKSWQKTDVPEPAK
jgi:hypothetical protein